MKKIFISILFAIISICSFAETVNDTIPIKSNSVREWIMDESVNSKGNPTITYYAIYDNQLVKTNATVYKQAALAKKYNVELNLAIVENRKNKSRRIILY